MTASAPPISAADVALAASEKQQSARGFFSLDLLDNRYPALHGLRVLAIVSVVQNHLTLILAGDEVTAFDTGLFNASQLVFFGMDVFFVLSGFLIGSILIRSLQQQGTQHIRRFYLRRAFRTFPLYYVVLTWLALTLPITAEQKSNLLYEYFYLTNFLPLDGRHTVMVWGWSLALEEQFYLAVPVLFFALHRLRTDRARFGLLAMLWAGALVVRLCIFFSHGPWNPSDLSDRLYYRTPTRYDTLVAGIVFAFVHDRYGPRLARWLEHPFHRALLGMWALACLWLLLRPAMFGQDHVQLVQVFSWGTVTSLMYAGVLPLLLYGQGAIQRALSAPIFRKIATLGYGVYLVHIPVSYFVPLGVAHTLRARHVSMIVVWPTALAASLLISLMAAFMLHVLVEKPALWVRRQLAG
jgi:peptidoglycan/LPS O-acetylase OafA/YrhL